MSEVFNIKIFYLQSIIYISLFFFFSFVDSLIIIITFKTVFSLAIQYYYGLVPMSGSDIIFTTSDKIEPMILHGSLIIESIDVNKTKELIIEKLLKTIPRFKLVPVYIYNEVYWKEKTLEEAINQIEIIENSDISNSNDVMKFAENEINKPFNQQDFLWRIFIIKFKQSNNGCLLLKADHMLLDGVSGSTLVCLLSENFENSIPIYTKPGILIKILGYISFPVFFIKHFYSVLKIKGTNFRETLTPQETKKKSLHMTKTFDFQQVSKINKKENVSFNDLMIYIISKSIHEVVKNKNSRKIDELLFVFPVNTREISKNIEDFKLENSFSFEIYKVPSPKNFKEDLNYIKSKIGQNLRNPLRNIQQSIFPKVSTLFPLFILHSVLGLLKRNIDLCFSNVMGPRIQLTFDGKKVLEINPFPDTFQLPLFIVCNTYNNNLRISIASEQRIGLDCELVKTEIENQILDLINKNNS